MTAMQPSILLRSLAQSKGYLRQTQPVVLAQTRRKSTDATKLVTETLDWPTYLSIRKSKRRWQMAATVPCAALGLASGALYFGSLDMDPTKMIFGIDPFFFYGICTVGCVGAGALVGPTLGSALWGVTHRRLIKLIDARDREFYEHIKQHRVDASLQSPTTPIPDYYGEKIGSLRDYRQWLRDQSKYRKRATLPDS